jgi:hypothetical protein
MPAPKIPDSEVIDWIKEGKSNNWLYTKQGIGVPRSKRLRASLEEKKKPIYSKKKPVYSSEVKQNGIHKREPRTHDPLAEFKKPVVKMEVPKYIKDSWDVLHANFVMRHRKLKQGPLKLAYQIVDEWMSQQ